MAKAEQSAELAEFDENIPWDEREAELKETREQEMSRLEQELAMLDKEVGFLCAILFQPNVLVPVMNLTV